MGRLRACKELKTQDLEAGPTFSADEKPAKKS
jgi:hypothetical protein